MAEHVYYLQPLLRLISALHTVIAFAMMVAYYCLKVCNLSLTTVLWFCNSSLTIVLWFVMHLIPTVSMSYHHYKMVDLYLKCELFVPLLIFTYLETLYILE